MGPDSICPYCSTCATSNGVCPLTVRWSAWQPHAHQQHFDHSQKGMLPDQRPFPPPFTLVSNGTRKNLPSPTASTAMHVPHSQACTKHRSAQRPYRACFTNGTHSERCYILTHTADWPECSSVITICLLCLCCSKCVM